jgi:hypothetical protein
VIIENEKGEVRYGFYANEERRRVALCRPGRKRKRRWVNEVTGPHGEREGERERGREM